MKANNPSRLTHKSKPPVKVRAHTVRIRRNAVLAALEESIEGAIRGAAYRNWKYRDDKPPPDDALESLVLSASDRVMGVIHDALDFGDGDV